MPKHPQGNALVFQAGGVTSVINQSLAGVVQEAMASPAIGRILGAIHGMDGVMQGSFYDLGRQPRSIWPRVARTPGAILGSARRKLRSGDSAAVLESFRRLDIRFLFPIGGNDSAETAHTLAMDAQAAGQPLTVVAIPKTVDNDLMEMDHCPGFGSAARFVALAVMGAGRDAESMGRASPITVLEVMGRNAGWLAAAAALGKREERDAPHVVCLPEVAFDEDRFLARMEEAFRKWGFALAVVNENLKGPKGPLGHRGEALHVDEFGHQYFESPAQYLAGRLSRLLSVRVRFEKPGTIQRSLVSCNSRVDVQEAFLAGQMAVRYAMLGSTDVMVTLLREPGARYRCVTGTAPLQAIAGRERVMPPEFIDQEAALPSPGFLAYARPLLGGQLPRFARLQ